MSKTNFNMCVSVYFARQSRYCFKITRGSSDG